jgi:hypothetical protein
MIKKIEFRACISPIMSGIRIGSDMMRVQFDIPKSDIQDAVPLLALTDTALKITVEVHTSPVATRTPDKPEGKKEKKPAKETGPHGGFWQKFCAGGRFNSLDLWQVLGAENAKDAEEMLRSQFSVSSRTFIDPADFISWLDRNELHALATEARRLEVQA